MKQQEELTVIVENVSKTFGTVQALDQVSFSVRAGEVFGLLGVNGAGKTTLIRSMAGTTSPDSGAIFVHGTNVHSDPRRAHEFLGVLTTDVGIYDRLTAYENVRYYADLAGVSRQESHETIQKLFKQFGIDAYQNRRAGKLSTGMRQKVALVRAVVHQPKVLILDEPTLGLDVLASQAVLEFVDHYRKKKNTTLLSTHNMHLAEEVCDRVAILHQGRIITIDTPKSLIQRTHSAHLEQAFLTLAKKKAHA